MLQFLSQQTILFYTMALICAWGVISQVVLRSMYGNLLRDVRRQGMAKGKFMKQLRQRYQNVCRMKQNTVNAFNTEAFIRKNLLEYRLFGGSLHTWKRMAQMAAILCAALGAVDAVNLDGGGSSTMVGSDGKVLNRPSDTGSAEVIVERKISTAVVISEVN